MTVRIFFLLVFMLIAELIYAQQAHPVYSGKKGISVKGLNLSYRKLDFIKTTSFFSFDINQKPWVFDKKRKYSGDTLLLKQPNLLIKCWPFFIKDGSCWMVEILNTGRTSINISNFIPFGESSDKVYIKPESIQYSNTVKKYPQLYRPGYISIDVLMPPNQKNTAFSSFETNERLNVSSLSKKIASNNRESDVGGNDIAVGKKIRFQIWTEIHQGKWQKGLEIFFRERFLYEIENFNQSLYQNPGYAWVKNAWVNLIMNTGDKQYYDAILQQSNYNQSISFFENRMGGVDIFTLSPLPSLNKSGNHTILDLYSNLPGGLAMLKQQIETAHVLGKYYFLEALQNLKQESGNDIYKDLSEIQQLTTADGIQIKHHLIPKTDLKDTGIKNKSGFVFYPENISELSELQYVVAGSENHSYTSPIINLTKFTKPDFSIFKSVSIKDDDFENEVALSFFNGHGLELNESTELQSDSYFRKLKFVGLTSTLLRQNANVFFRQNYQLLIPTIKDSLWVNKWPSEEKIIFTVYCSKPDGYAGPLFMFDEKHMPLPSDPEKYYHLVSIWNHEEALSSKLGNKEYIHTNTKRDERETLNTSAARSIDCIALFPKLLHTKLHGDTLAFGSDFGDRIRISAGNPSWKTDYVDFESGHHNISLYRCFGSYTGKIVIQLFAGNELQDERITYIPHDLPRLISTNIKSHGGPSGNKGMLKITGGFFKDKNDSIKDFENNDSIRIFISGFFIDSLPVTNLQFQHFLKSSGYTPADTARFLKHWKNGIIPENQEDKAVVYISLEDARAFAMWAGKRLPSEKEWLYAQSFIKFQKKHNRIATGNINPGVEDTLWLTKPEKHTLTKNNSNGWHNDIWNYTNDEYDNGRYIFVVLKKGIAETVDESNRREIEYPDNSDYRYQLILCGPSNERSEMIGFRCVKD